MLKFAYTIRDASGRADTGVLTAADTADASRMLREQGKTIVSLQKDRGQGVAAAPAPRKKRIRRDDVIHFATQLAVMVDTGVPLSEALDAISGQCKHPSMQVVIRDLSDQVQSGTEFSAALDRHPKVFSRLFSSLVRASEASGTMGEMLQRASEYMEQERETRKQIKGAMMYPACMLSFCVLVVVALLVFIMPRFEKIYSGKGATLPLPTRALLGVSGALVSYWPFILVGLAGAGVGAYFYFRSPNGKILLDGIRIHLPVLGSMYRKAYLARSLRTMATMVSTGVEILEGLEIAGRVAGNYYYSKIWLDVSKSVKEGSTLSDELGRCSLVPATITQMISAGERTGRLSMVMNRVAKFCEDDLRIAVKTVTSMIEPAMIIVMGVVIGGIAMALLLPIFSISKVVAH